MTTDYTTIGLDPELHLEPNLGTEPVMLAVTGSRLYGNWTDTSDVDVRGVFVHPYTAYGCLSSPSERHTTGPHPDTVLYEARKFVHMCLGGNPNITELLYHPHPGHTTNAWHLLVGQRNLLLSARKVASSHSGFAYTAMANFSRDAADSQRGTKLRWHVLRVLYFGTQLLEHGVMTPVLSSDIREQFDARVQSGDDNLNAYVLTQIEKLDRLAATHPRTSTAKQFNQAEDLLVAVRTLVS